MRYILILLWLLLGLSYYLMANHCREAGRPDTSAIEHAQAQALPTSKAKSSELPCPTIGPFAFKRSSAELIKTAQWESYKDSLLALLQKDKKIQIIGLQMEGESDAGSVAASKSAAEEELAMSRARVLSEALGLTEERLQIYTSNTGKADFKTDCLIPGARVKMVTVTEKIKEVQDRTLIYFPYNSTKKLNDQEVEAYLDALARQVRDTGERIRLTGHTDDKGEPDYNLELGQYRAEVIKRYLISKGVASDKVVALSRGETRPIADNQSKEGRAQNRRTELEIIK